MIQAGRLRHRVVIQRPVESQDSTTGAITTTWQDVATIWAEISPLSAKEFIVSQTEQSKVSARITVRYRDDFDRSYRLYHEAKKKYYNIEGILSDKDSGFEYLTIPVSEGVRYIDEADTFNVSAHFQCSSEIDVVTFVEENTMYSNATFVSDSECVFVGQLISEDLYSSVEFGSSSQFIAYIQPPYYNDLFGSIIFNSESDCSFNGRIDESYLPESLAIFAAMTVTPTDERKELINETVGSLIDSGVWDKLDLFLMFSAHNEQAARVNWVDPGNIATSVNSPVFTVDSDFSFAGTSYLSTGIEFADGGYNYTQNSCHLGVKAFNITADSGATRDLGWVAEARIVVRAGGTKHAQLNYTGAAQSLTLTTTNDSHFVGSRLNGTDRQVYIDAVEVVSADQTPTGPISAGDLTVSSVTSGGRRLRAAHAGGGLTQQNVTDLNSIISTYISGL